MVIIYQFGDLRKIVYNIGVGNKSNGRIWEYGTRS